MYLRSLAERRKEDGRGNAAHTGGDFAYFRLGIDHSRIDHHLAGDVLEVKRRVPGVSRRIPGMSKGCLNLVLNCKTSGQRCGRSAIERKT